MSPPWAPALLRGVLVRIVAGRLPALVCDGMLTAYLVAVWVDPLRFGMDRVRAVGALFLFELLALLCGAFVWGVREDPRSRWALLLVVPFVLASGAAVQAPILTLFFLWRLATLAAPAPTAAAHQILELKVRHLGAWGLWLLTGLASIRIPLLGWAELPPGLGWESATAESDFRVFGPWLAVYFGLRFLVGATGAHGWVSRKLGTSPGRGSA